MDEGHDVTSNRKTAPKIVIDAMQAAVDIVHTSEHDRNKISATIFSDDPYNGTLYSAVNTRPAPLTETFPWDARFGNSSSFVHAETFCIAQTRHSADLSMCVTDPFCPNCAKNMAMAGIKNAYIDHKGFHKDFATRRMEYFKSMSQTIAENCGMGIHIIYRKLGVIETILAPQNVEANVLNLPKAEPMDHDISLTALSEQCGALYGDTPYACAIAQDAKRQSYSLHCPKTPSPGMDPHAMPEEEDDKYSYWLDPVNTLLLTTARLGLTLSDHALFSSIVPHARAQINALGWGVQTIYLRDKSKAEDNSSVTAMMQLVEKNALRFATTK